MNFQEKLSRGKTGESEIAAWFRGRGFNVLPVYEIANGQYKGPAVYAANGDTHAAPDMLAFKADGAVWIEAKNKSAFTWHRLSEEWTTGIDIKHYNDYQKVQGLSAWPVWLLFLQNGMPDKDTGEPSPAGLYGGSIKQLEKNEHHRYEKPENQYGNGGMVYWAHTQLRKLSDYPLYVPCKEQP